MKRFDFNDKLLNIEQLRNYDKQRENNHIKLFQSYLTENDPTNLNFVRPLQQILEVRQSDPTSTKEHIANYQQKPNIFISQGNADGKNWNKKIQQFMDQEKQSPQMLKNHSIRESVNLNASLLNYNQNINYMQGNDYRSFSSRTSQIMNYSNVQTSSVNPSDSTQLQSSMEIFDEVINPQSSRTFQPYIIYRNRTEEPRCNCRALECSTQKCSCFLRQRMCTLRCLCDSSNCRNHQHVMDSQSSEDQDSSKSNDQSEEKNLPVQINLNFAPPDFSLYTDQILK